MHCPPGPAWQCCPRSALARVLQQAEDRLGMTVKAGFESEFYLLSSSKQQGPSGLPAPIDDSHYCQSTGMDAAAAGQSAWRRQQLRQLPGVLPKGGGSAQMHITCK